MPSLADFLSAYGGTPDPENPSSGEITPGLVLRAIGHVAAPGLVNPPDFDPNAIQPSRGSAFTPAKTSREYATQLSGQKTNIDPLETMLGVAGGSPAMLAGPMARTANKAALAVAESMLVKGATPDEIRNQTGWFQGAEGKWRFEIPDINSAFTPAVASRVEAGQPVRGGDIGKAFEHPDLYAAYPELADLPLSFSDPTKRPGWMSRGAVTYVGGEPQKMYLNPKAFTPEMSKAMGDLPAGIEGMRSTTLHELQHMIQAREGFARGGTPWTPEVQAAAHAEIIKTKADIQAQLDALQARATADPKFRMSGEYGKQLLTLIQAKTNAANDVAFKHYGRLAGEVESNTVQARADMTPEQLRATPPWVTQEVPYDQQLMRFGDMWRLPAKPGEQLKLDLSAETAPSFYERMVAGQGQAQIDRNRGLGNIVPREAPNEPPLLAPGETRGDVVRALTPGLPPAETSIADIGRTAYRGTPAPEPRPSIADIGQQRYRERLTPFDAELSGKPTTEMTPIGEQYVLPGAERLTPAQMAQRQANAPLKPTVAQEQPGGLFAPEGEQLGLELSGRPIKAPAVLRPDRPLFDLSPQGLARSHVQREQFDIPRTAAETVTPEYERATSKANIARVNREVAQGIKEHGLDWHAMGQLRDRYIADLGEKAGAAEFERYMMEVGATSPNSNVEQNFRTASYYAQQRRAGEPLPKISYKRSTGNPYLPPREAPPTPYGNRAQGLHVMNLGLLERGEPYPLSRPKVPSFTENMLGNYRPVAVDRHNLRMWGIDAEAPNLTGYKHLERTQQEQAGKMGIHPAQYQAAPWPFYAKSGADPALALFDKRLTHTAEARGQTKAQVLRDFIRGAAPLLSLTPAAVLLGQGQPAPEPAQ